jgi:uncharacterized protein
MKYLLIFGLVMVVFWLWRSSRQKITPPPADNARPPPTTRTTEVVACAVCHVHLPRTEALAGKHGLYCSAAHRQQADR